VDRLPSKINGTQEDKDRLYPVSGVAFCERMGRIEVIFKLSLQQVRAFCYPTP
jgi:hypothetical protein